MGDACMLGDVPIGQMHIRKERARTLVDVPAHDAHLSGITNASALALDLVLLVCSMNEIMAPLTEGDEIIGAVTTRLSRLNMMDIQDRVF